MDLKDYDKLEIPENLNDYINKGIEKGINYETKHKSDKYKILKRVASVLAISTITLTTVSNIPIFANELIKIPIIGELVKVLDFRKSTEFGGIVTDGSTMIVDSLEKNNINIYFSKDREVINDLPAYEISYSEYPYTLFIKFSGVREYYDTKIQEKISNMPYVKDVYKIIMLDDSSYKIAIEFNENIEYKVEEHKNPGILKISMSKTLSNIAKKEAYFIRSDKFDYGEQLAQVEEMLIDYENVNIQKSSTDKYIVQIGPYENINKAKEILEKIENDKYIGTKFFIENRISGEGPK